MTKISRPGKNNSLFARFDTAFRLMLIGLVVAAAGVLLGFALGNHTTGPVAEAAALLATSGVGLVLVAGSVRFVLVIVKIWLRVRRGF